MSPEVTTKLMIAESGEEECVHVCLGPLHALLGLCESCLQVTCTVEHTLSGKCNVRVCVPIREASGVCLHV